jgi:hypothetical protein
MEAPKNNRFYFEVYQGERTTFGQAIRDKSDELMGTLCYDPPHPHPKKKKKVA